MTGKPICRALAVGTTAVLLASAVLISHPAETTARTHVVRCGQGADLQAALWAARGGDVLRVRGVCRGTFIVRKDVTIQGAGPAAALDGHGDGPVVRVTATADAKIASLTIRNGRLAEWPRRGEEFAGGLANRGRLRLVRVTVEDHYAAEQNGTAGIANLGSLILRDSAVRRCSKGLTTAIWNGEGASLRLVRTRVTDNRGYQQAAIVRNFGVAALVDSVVRGNHSEDTTTPGILNHGRMELRRTKVQDNLATHGTGGIVNAGRLEIHGSVISGNRGDLHPGGGIRNTSSGRLLLEDSIVRGNRVEDVGGGIANEGIARIRRSRIDHNTAHHDWDGGGIHNTGTLHLRRTWIHHNAAGEHGGEGGGIYNVGTLSRFKVWMWKNTPDDCTGC